MVRNLLPRVDGPLKTALLGFFALLLIPNQLTRAGELVPVPTTKPVVVLAAADVAASLSGVTAPVPPVKPSMNNTESPKGDHLIEYSLKDFQKAQSFHITDKNTPVPGRKPTGAILADAAHDAARYKDIFTLQAMGDMDGADKQIKRLKNKNLMGHVLFQRYMHPTAYTSSFKDLRDWLESYSDHPGAKRVYDLARTKQPESFKGSLVQPREFPQLTGRHDPAMGPRRSYKSAKERSQQEQQTIAAFQKSVRKLLAQGQITKAHQSLQSFGKTKRLLDAVEYDLIQAGIAAEYLYAGRVDEAYHLARESAQRSGLQVPIASWVAGLASWQDDSHKRAAPYFETVARSPYSSNWMSAAGSFWAARAYTERGDVKKARHWMEQAAKQYRTFYGLIATRTLGQHFSFNWSTPVFSRDDYNILAKTKAGARAMSLVAAGQPHLAEAELLRMGSDNKRTRRALLAFAGYAKLPAVALRVGGSVPSPQGSYYDTAFYPTGAWKPRDGYKIDPSLIHAIIRQESRFNPHAESVSGAKGLMQVMPRTADFIAGGLKLDLGKNHQALFEPQINLSIGQSYLSHLMEDNYVQGDIVSLLVAYNGGPGNLARWKDRWGHVDDPLLFIELVPLSETRAYVEQVLANYWIYRLRENLPTPTLDRLAFGKNAEYAENSGWKAFKITAR